MTAVCGISFPSEKAFLAGYGRYLIRNEVFPAIATEKNACTEGLLYRGLNPKSIHLLDVFEGKSNYPFDLTITGIGIGIGYRF